MNAHVPSLQRTIEDLLADYDAKHIAAEAAASAFEAAIDSVREAAGVSGFYGGQVVDVRMRPTAKDIRKALLKSAWKAAWSRCNIDRVASAADRQKFERAVEDPPPFTLENLKATFGDYVMRPRFHVLKGLAEVFVQLDPAYKSHCKVRIGVKALPKRIILSSFAGYGSYGRERLTDLVRALAAFRGEPIPSHEDFAAVEGLHSYFQPRQGEAQVRGLTVRVFVNRNAHVIFPPDLLLDVNRALAEFYGDVLPDADDDDQAKPRASTAVSKDLQYYPTPPAVVEQLMRAAYIEKRDRWSDDRPPLNVLEPSCGCGRILDGLKARGVKALGVEIYPGRAAQSRAKGHAVINRNFLETIPEPTFDRVVMNPPFYGRHYVKHVRHALRFLKPGGLLATVLPATAHYDHGELAGEWTDLPVASFSESGTNVPTGILFMRAPQ